MAGLKFYSGNRLESLCDRLARVVSKPLSSPLTPEVIVVQSKGMERWLSMELAQKAGVWMNCRFPFPNAFVWEMMAAVLDDIPDISAFSPPVMTWRIMGLLTGRLEEKAFEILRNYLTEGADNFLKRLQVSERIADVFDRYTIYRPEMILRWEEGEDDRWQAKLWRDLAAGNPGRHRAATWTMFMERLKAGKIDPSLLPERVSVFGIPVLPRYHFEALRGLGTVIDVHFFLMNPTREYWADIVPESRIGREYEEDFHFDVGNPLLASMGKLGRDFFSMTMNVDADEQTAFEDPRETCLLAAIQSDILHLRNRGRTGERLMISRDDRSVQVHSCHSPMREIEVLHDHLLALFDSHRDLTPRDIVVMTPDIDTYASYITAVFSGDRDGQRRIPFSIADRRAPSESTVIDVFLKILGLCRGRFGAPDVLDILDTGPVLRQFGFGRGDTELIVEWVTNSGIRWGMDEDHRARLGLPDFRENSWRAGVERLLLGYALRGNEERLFNDILPYDDMEGNETEVLGRFLDFVERLVSCVRELESPRTLSGWAEALMNLIALFIADDEDNRRELLLLKSHVRDLRCQQEASGFSEPIPLEVVRYYLEKRLREEELSGGFITGAVTFCEMLPMRSIPFRVVCLVGMNSDAYPREYRPVGFDLMAHDPRPGDRSLRDEDRYLFLEAILSARECLYVSYVGQSIRDNSEIPSSVLVSELLDYVGDGFEVCDGTGTLEHLVTKHKLQAFSASYFSGEGRLFSYSQEDCDAAEIGSGPPSERKPFLAAPIRAVGGEPREIAISGLRSFFRNTCRYFLNHRMGVYFSERASVPSQDESFYRLDALQDFTLKSRLVDMKLEGEELDPYYRVARGQGTLSPGAPGKSVFSENKEIAETLAVEVASRCTGSRLPPLDINITVNGFRITGRLDKIWTSGMVAYRTVKNDKIKHHLDVWIDHLLLNCAAKPSYPETSMFLCIGKAWRYTHPEDSEAVLATLLTHYVKGQAEPLRFFPESSGHYVERLEGGGTRDRALQAARSQWEGSGFGPGRGEGDDPYHHLCFGGVDPFDDTFAAIAVDVLAPMFAHREKLKR